MNNMSEYIRFSKNYKENILIPIKDSPYQYIKDTNVPYFISMMKYNQEQYNKWKETKSLGGMSGGKTNKIWADFDSKADLKKAFTDCIVFVDNLMAMGFTEKNIQISFSGSKGVGIIVENNQELTIEEVKALCTNISEGLTTFDTAMYDHQRIFRLLFTKNEKTGLYKIPLSYEELKEANVDLVKEYASDLNLFDQNEILSYYTKANVSIPKNLITYIPLKRNEVVEKDLSFDLVGFDFKNKPTYLDNARWLLMNGFFRGSETGVVGERSNALLCLASTLKNVGYAKEHVYRMLKGVAELQAKRTGETRFSDTELYNNIVMQVYGPSWKGGQYTIKDPNSWLYKYAERMDVLEEETESRPIITLNDVEKSFVEYVRNIEQNTILTGIKELDEHLPLTIGTNVGIVGAAGSGKTSLILEILKNTSMSGVTSVFASLDMHRNRVFEKLLYKVSGRSRKDLYKLYKEGKGKEITNRITEQYGNVYFYDRSGPTVDDIRDYILEIEKSTGNKVKLVMLDYFERVYSEISDETSSSKRIANELQDLVNDLNVCLITMVQPNKFSIGGGADTPIKSYTAIKGSSFLYQSFRVALSIWRPFYNVDTPELDNFMQMAILKNDLGELRSFDFHWEGKTGTIRSLEDNERVRLYDLLEQKENGKKKKEDW